MTTIVLGTVKRTTCGSNRKPNQKTGLMESLDTQYAGERKKERYINVFERPKWPIRPNKRLHLKCFLVFENTSK